MTNQPNVYIEKVYDKPLSCKSPIQMNYGTPVETRDALFKSHEIIDDLVESYRESLGVSHILPLNMSKDQAEKLRIAIKADPVWKEGLYGVIQAVSPEFKAVDENLLLGAITIPWWNASVLNRLDDKYSTKCGLSIDALVSHSYITQLTRSPQVRQVTESTNSHINSGEAMSIANVLVTKDNLMVLGLRGGHSYANTLMVTPAGSVEYHSGKNPLFETIYAEHFEELGLAKDQLHDVSLVGRIYDTTNRLTLYASSSKVDMTFAELLSLWGSAIDNREHKFLVPIPNHPQDAMQFIQSHAFNMNKVDPKSVSLTTPENVNTILPSAVGSILTYFASHEGHLWAKKAEGMLYGDYIFR